MDHHLSIEDSLRFGWEKTRAHSTLIFQALLTLFGLQIAQQIVSKVLAGTLDGALATAALILMAVVAGIGFTVIILRLARGHSAEYGDLVPRPTVWISYLAANILTAVVIVVPMVIALVVCLSADELLPPEVATGVTVFAVAAAFVAAAYFGLRYAFVRFAILEDSDIIKSLRTSAHLTRGHKWWLLGFVIVMAILNIIGALLLMVGLLVTVPVTMIAFAHVYVQLHERHHAANQ